MTSTWTNPVMVEPDGMTPYGPLSTDGDVVGVETWVVAAAATSGVALCRHARRAWGFDGVAAVDRRGTFRVTPWDASPPRVYELFPAVWSDGQGAPFFMAVRRS